MAPGGYFLIQSGTANGASAPCTALPSPDGVATINMSATTGKVALVNGTTLLACGATATPCDDATTIDRVAYGPTATDAETAPAPLLTNQLAAMRTAGCVDTDNNSVDFTAGTPAFRTTCSGTPPPTSTSTPTATPTATPGGSPTATPMPLRIHDIQGAAHLSPFASAPVANVFGIVTFKHQAGTGVFGFFIQDTPDQYDADDRTSEGILVFTSADPISRVSVGDAVRVSGTVSEFRAGGASSANLTTTEINASDAGITIVSSGNPLPTGDGHRRRWPPAADGRDRRRPGHKRRGRRHLRSGYRRHRLLREPRRHAGAVERRGRGQPAQRFPE